MGYQLIIASLVIEFMMNISLLKREDKTKIFSEELTNLLLKCLDKKYDLFLKRDDRTIWKNKSLLKEYQKLLKKYSEKSIRFKGG